MGDNQPVEDPETASAEEKAIQDPTDRSDFANEQEPTSTEQTDSP